MRGLTRPAPTRHAMKKKERAPTNDGAFLPAGPSPVLESLGYITSTAATAAAALYAASRSAPGDDAVAKAVAKATGPNAKVLGAAAVAVMGVDGTARILPGLGLVLPKLFELGGVAVALGLALRYLRLGGSLDADVAAAEAWLGAELLGAGEVKDRTAKAAAAVARGAGELAELPAAALEAVGDDAAGAGLYLGLGLAAVGLADALVHLPVLGQLLPKAFELGGAAAAVAALDKYGWTGATPAADAAAAAAALGGLGLPLFPRLDGAAAAAPSPPEGGGEGEGEGERVDTEVGRLADSPDEPPALQDDGDDDDDDDAEAEAEADDDEGPAAAAAAAEKRWTRGGAGAGAEEAEEWATLSDEVAAQLEEARRATARAAERAGAMERELEELAGQQGAEAEGGAEEAEGGGA